MPSSWRHGDWLRYIGLHHFVYTPICACMYIHVTLCVYAGCFWGVKGVSVLENFLSLPPPPPPPQSVCIGLCVWFTCNFVYGKECILIFLLVEFAPVQQ